MILFKKAVRAMWANKKAYLACILLITIGVFMNNVLSITSNLFSTARDRYYREYRLADVFAKVRAMPAAALAELAQTEGVAEAAGRYVYDARILIPGNDKLITLRVSSVDSSYEGMPLNGVAVTGEDFSEPTDIMVGGAFLQTHGLAVGDTIRAVIEKKEYDLRVCAAADSPEYVYPVKDARELLPDPETFGYAFMSQDGLWALANKRGFFNDISLELAEGFTYGSVKSPLEDQLAKSGLLSMYPREDLPSVAMVDMELTSIGTMSGTLPLVFMMIAMVVLYLMLKRIIEQERTQIGVLKAFGYSANAIMLHYTLYGAVTGLAGGALGCVYGLAAIGPYVTMFKQFFNLPTQSVEIPLPLLARGFGIALGAGVLGGYFGARRSLLLNPADAMRPEAPKAVKFDLLGKLPPLRALLSSGGSLAVRGIIRNKMRSGVIVVGIMFSFGMLCFMGSYNVMVEFMLINQFSKVQRYDAKVSLVTPAERDAAAQAVYGVDGVELAESILELPVELSNRNLKTGVNLLGLGEASALYAIYDNGTEAVFPPPADGLLINDVLAQQLDADTGDTLYLSSTLLDADIPMTVTGVVEQNLAMAAYMEQDAMSELFHLSGAATSVVARVGDMDGLTELLDSANNVAFVEDKATTLRNYEEFMAPYGALIYIMWVMSVVVAFAIIYNTSAISLSERKREYATLRVMGMHVKEVGAIMGFEYWVLCAAGMLLGVPFNALLKQGLASVFASDTFTFPTFTPAVAYVQATAGCMAAVLLANRSAARQIAKFDMVEVLKERE